MIEKEFKDRIPRKPGEVELTPVAGATNRYKLTRADDPSEEGTPLNKATFNSIIHSRLTGRYYDLDVSQETLSIQASKIDPIPSTGWTENSKTDFVSGSYKLTSSSPDSSNLATRAFDNSTSTYFASEGVNKEIFIAIDFGTRILVKKISGAWFSYSGNDFEIRFQGSNDGSIWETIASTTGNRETPSEWDLNNTKEYSAYRLLFKQYTDNSMFLYDWSITDWTVNTYSNVFTSEGMPSEWTKGQRVMIETTADVNTVGIASNTLNDVSVNTILQPAKRYELVYNGTSFIAKEV